MTTVEYRSGKSSKSFFNLEEAIQWAIDEYPILHSNIVGLGEWYTATGDIVEIFEESF